jgi:FkbM family methyltransferase
MSLSVSLRLVAVGGLALTALSCTDRQPAPAPLLGARPQAPAFDQKIAMEKSLYSAHNEEALIRAFFRDRRWGFFLDVGCYKPVEASNTYYLERHLRWSGIGVDALREFAPLWRSERPRSKFFALLVSDHSDTLDTFYRSELTDASSVKKQRVEEWKTDDGVVPFTELKVPTITLTKLLDGNGVQTVDFVSMDIEGAEPGALAGFDIDRFRPYLLCVEVTWRTRQEIHAYFDQHHYSRIEAFFQLDPHNEYYAPQRPRPLWSPAERRRAYRAHELRRGESLPKS